MSQEIRNILKTCSLCKVSFSSLRELIAHEITHGQPTSSSAKNSLVSSIQTENCSSAVAAGLANASLLSSAATSDVEATNSSILLHDTWRCPICSAYLSSRKSFNKHFAQWHIEETQSSAHSHTRTSGQFRSLDYRNRRLHRIWKYRCVFCSASFAKKNSFEQHMKIHVNGKVMPVENVGSKESDEDESESTDEDEDDQISRNGGKSEGSRSITSGNILGPSEKSCTSAISEIFVDPKTEEPDDFRPATADPEMVENEAKNPETSEFIDPSSEPSPIFEEADDFRPLDPEVVDNAKTPETREIIDPSSDQPPIFKDFTLSRSLSKLHRAFFLESVTKPGETVEVTPRLNNGKSSIVKLAGSSETVKRKTEFPVTCEYCLGIFCSYKSLRVHQNHVHFSSTGKKKKPKYFCYKCDGQKHLRNYFKNKKEFEAHLISEHGHSNEESGKLTSVQKRSSIIENATVDALSDTEGPSTYKPMKSKFCRFCWNHYVCLESHQFRLHYGANQKVKYFCSICSGRGGTSFRIYFSDESEFQAHLALYHGILPDDEDFAEPEKKKRKKRGETAENEINDGATDEGETGATAWAIVVKEEEMDSDDEREPVASAWEMVVKEEPTE